MNMYVRIKKQNRFIAVNRSQQMQMARFEIILWCDVRFRDRRALFIFFFIYINLHFIIFYVKTKKKLNLFEYLQNTSLKIILLWVREKEKKNNEKYALWVLSFFFFFFLVRFKFYRNVIYTIRIYIYTLYRCDKNCPIK